jgi:hypothetical protein
MRAAVVTMFPVFPGAAALARTAAAARSCGVAAAIATIRAAIVTMRSVFPGAAALARAWNLYKTLKVFYGVGCQIRRQAGHGAARRKALYLRGVWPG